MAKKMSDDEVMNFVYGKLFGDLDGIEGHALFDDDDVTPNDDVMPNAKPEAQNSGGVKISIEPLMANAAESDKLSSGDDEEEEDDEDRLKGIGDMSPLMAQLHGKR